MSKSKVFGYARVSSKDQNLDKQIQQLLEYGINEDLVVICSIDRLGRNYSEIVQQWDYITNKAMRLINLTKSSFYKLVKRFET